MAEIWLPVVWHEDLYEVSNLGQVRNRTTKRVLTPRLTDRGYPAVKLHGHNQRVHRLVALAFHGIPEAGQQVRHLNDIKTDNRAANLAWGSQSQNARDAVEHKRGIVARTHCAQGHEFTPENTRYDTNGWRQCWTCRRERKRLARQRH